MMYLECRGLVKRFGDTTAVDSISFGIERGELVSLLGPSGCGKTTTLRLLAGFEAPNAGDMYLDGRRLNGMPPEKRGVGVVFQHFALFPHMTVWQNIAYGLRFRRRADRSEAEIVRELIRIVGLEGLERRRPGELSAGQQQRVAIARSLAPGPDLLLLDEPLSALDARLRQHLRMEIRRIQRMLGLTLLYVTHDQEEAMAISDRMIVMNAGRIEQIGEPWQVYHRPATPFVASFLGHTNRLRGRVERQDGTDWMIALEGAATPWAIFPSETVQAALKPGMAVEVVIAGERVVPEVQGDAVAGAVDVPLANGRTVVVTGSLQETEFLGSHARLYVAGPQGERWTIRIPSMHLLSFNARIGESVACRFATEDAVVFEAHRQADGSRVRDAADLATGATGAK